MSTWVIIHDMTDDGVKHRVSITASNKIVARLFGEIYVPELSRRVCCGFIQRSC